MSGEITKLVRTLVAVNATPDQILAAVETAEATKDEAIEESRAKARARVKKWRENHPETARNVTKRSVAVTSRLTRAEDSSSNSKISGNKEDISHEFETEIWPAYPRKAGKGAALKAYISARKRASFEAILAGVCRYARERAGEDAQFTKHAQGWFNGDHWADEPIPKRPPSTASPPAQDFNAILDAIQGKPNATHPGQTIDGSHERTDWSGSPSVVQLHALPARR